VRMLIVTDGSEHSRRAVDCLVRHRGVRDGGYDLVVIGSHGRGFLRRARPGSVASKVLPNCEVPVPIGR